MALDSVFYNESGQPLLTQAGFKIDNINKRIIKKQNNNNNNNNNKNNNKTPRLEVVVFFSLKKKGSQRVAFSEKICFEGTSSFNDDRFWMIADAAVRRESARYGGMPSLPKLPGNGLRHNVSVVLLSVQSAHNWQHVEPI